jgi:hypothetical protein
MERAEIRAAIFGLIVGAVAISVEVFASKRRDAVRANAKAAGPPQLQIVRPVTTTGWTKEPTTRISLLPSRQYVATLELTGLERTFGDASDVEAELRKLAPWRALAVYDDPSKLPAGPLPVDRGRVGGRFWALGVPSGPIVTTLDEGRLTALWSRPAPKLTAARA